MPNLVGIGNSQVPTNAMLGGMAYQDPSNVNLESFEPGEISKIKAVIAREAAGANTKTSTIFVYDTRKDSDGGAWRHRTQHTSWYNEPLGTVWRGTRREFPEVAILMTTNYNSGLADSAQSIGFNIYDGDDPNCPLWLRFPLTNYQQLSNWGGGLPMIARPNAFTFDSGCISALNGQISYGNRNTGSMVGYMVNMISEKCIDVCRYGVSTSQFYHMSSNIASRVNYNTWSNRAFPAGGVRYYQTAANHDGNKSGVIGKMGAAKVNDIRMIVSDDAKIDPCTGLPQPTQIWGTASGLGVINGNSYPMTVNVDQVGSYAVIGLSNFNSRKGILAINQSGNVIRLDYYNPSDGYTNNSTAQYYYYNLASNANPSIPWHPGSDIIRFLTGSYPHEPDDLVHANQVSVQFFLGRNTDGTGGDTSAIAATVTTDMVTGYQPGDPHNALPGYCGTPGDITGTVHYYDNFSDNSGSWSFADGASITGGNLRLSSTNGSRATRAVSGFLVNGTEYYCEYQVASASQNFQFDDDGPGSGQTGGTLTVYSDVTHQDTGFYAFTFTARQSNRLRVMRTQGGGGNIDIGYIRIRPTQIENRHNNYQDARPGFAIVGTLKRQPVAPGAELCSYSNWGQNNGTNGFIAQGYNTALNWGTDNFMISFWFKCAEGGTETTENLLGIGDFNHNDGFLIQAVNSANNKYINIGYLGVSNSFAYDSSKQAGYHDQAWNHIFLHKIDNTFHLYINGEKSIYNSGGTWTASSINWTTKWGTGKRNIIIGGRAGNYGGATNAWASPTTEIALVRISGNGSAGARSRPTADEIRKIYDDESKMFAPGAQVTLAGSTNLVRAMDYDEKKQILHIGTHDGRSDFRRLVRINSTTERVDTAISAYDGFIAEQ